MPLPLEHSAIVIAANVPELERRYRRLAEEISLVASHLADTEPELAQLTKLRDEIEFAAENLKERSESAEVQAASADLSSACSDLIDVLFDFRRHHNGSQSELDEPHPLGADLVNDLSDEPGEDRDFVAQQVQQPINNLFEAMRTSAARIKSATPEKLAPLYELDEFFATAANSVALLDDKARFDKVQHEIIPKYRALFKKCCESYPRLKQHFAESFDDERFSSEMIKHRQLLLNALRDIENAELPGHTLQVSNDNSLVAQPHSYGGVKLPGEPSGWHELVKDGVTLYGRRLKLQNKPARVLMRLIISRKRLSIQDLACVDSSWQKDIDSADDDISASGDNNIRTALSRLRKALCGELGIPKARQREVITEFDMQPTVWELNWELLNEYGFAKGKQTQE
jgi:hypothetical protein